MARRSRLLKLAESLESRIEGLRGKFGEIGDARLTVMAALTVCDELLDASQRIRKLEEELDRLARRPRGCGRSRQGDADRGDQRAQLRRRPHREDHPGAEPHHRRRRGDRLISSPPPREGEAAAVNAGGLAPSSLHWPGEAVSRVRSHISPGPYRSFRELSLAGSVDPVIWCPPTFVGNSGIEHSNGHRGFALLFFCCLCRAVRYPVMLAPVQLAVRITALDVSFAERAIEGRSPYRCSREARRVERQQARRRGARLSPNAACRSRSLRAPSSPATRRSAARSIRRP